MLGFNSVEHKRNINRIEDTTWLNLWLCGFSIHSFPVRKGTFFETSCFYREELLQDLATSESIGGVVEEAKGRLNFRRSHPMVSATWIPSTSNIVSVAEQLYFNRDDHNFVMFV